MDPFVQSRKASSPLTSNCHFHPDKKLTNDLFYFTSKISVSVFLLSTEQTLLILWAYLALYLGGTPITSTGSRPPSFTSFENRLYICWYVDKQKHFVSTSVFGKSPKIAHFCLIFYHFLIKILRKHAKQRKRRFWPAFGVWKIQTLVEIYNT